MLGGENTFHHRFVARIGVEDESDFHHWFQQKMQILLGRLNDPIPKTLIYYKTHWIGPLDSSVRNSRSAGNPILIDMMMMCHMLCLKSLTASPST